MKNLKSHSNQINYHIYIPIHFIITPRLPRISTKKITLHVTSLQASATDKVTATTTTTITSTNPTATTTMDDMSAAASMEAEGRFNPFVVNREGGGGGRHKSSPMLTIDFETYGTRPDTISSTPPGSQQGGGWFAAAAAVAIFPSGQVIHTYQCSIFKEMDEFDASERGFWNGYQETKRRLDDEAVGRGGGDGRHPTDHEKRRGLVDFVREMHRIYPNLRVICDNISMDVRFINNEATMQGKPLVSIRHDGTYSQPVCTTSYRSAVLGMGGSKSPTSCVAEWHSQIFSPYYAAGGGGGGTGYQREVDMLASTLPPHYPLGDCMRTFASHFQVLDIVDFYRNHRLTPMRTMKIQHHHHHHHHNHHRHQDQHQKHHHHHKQHHAEDDDPDNNIMEETIPILPPAPPAAPAPATSKISYMAAAAVSPLSPLIAPRRNVGATTTPTVAVKISETWHERNGQRRVGVDGRRGRGRGAGRGGSPPLPPGFFRRDGGGGGDGDENWFHARMVPPQ